MSTAYENAPTAWDMGQRDTPPQSQAASRLPEVQLGGLEVQGPWETVQLTASRAAQTVDVERDIMNVFTTRAKLAQRLRDAFNRKDEQMAATSAQKWIESEVQLSRIFHRYQVHMQERNALVEQLKNAEAIPPI